jgi:dsRNA-specific ribonuclease
LKSSTSGEAEFGVNQSLEFLGDAILQFISTRYLYHKYSNASEAELTVGKKERGKEGKKEVSVRFSLL